MALVKFPTPKVIAVDIDGTLLIDGQLNQPAVDWIRTVHRNGFFTFLWSIRGHDYAKEFVEKYQLGDAFDAVLPKPGYCLDDKGWDWTEYTKVISPGELA